MTDENLEKNDNVKLQKLESKINTVEAFSKKSFILLAMIMGLLLLIAFLMYGESAKEVPSTNLQGYLTEKDMNFIKEASFVNNGCEKLGLITTVYVQQDYNTGKYFGLPVCVSRDNNA